MSIYKSSIHPVRSSDGSVTALRMTLEDVTDFRVFERDAAALKVRSELALTLSKVGVWEADLNTGENKWSDSTWNLYGLKKESVKASREAWISIVHPADREMAVRDAETAIQQNVEYNGEYRICRPDGSVKWLMARGLPIVDSRGIASHYVGIVIDITDRKLIGNELAKRRRHMDFALERSHIGVWELNLKDHSIIRTPEQARIFGYDEELSGWSLEIFLDHIVPEDRYRVETLIKNSIQGQQDYTFECRIRRPNGEIRWIAAKGVFHVDSVSAEKYVLGIVEDITDRKQMESEHDLLQAQLQHAQKLDLLGQLAGGIAHDFNNHLTSILGNAELALSLADESLPFVQSLKHIRESAIRSSGLTKQLLAFARKQLIMPKVIDIDKEIETLLPILIRLIDGSIQFEWCPRKHNTLIHIDPAQIDQILTNLCINAHDAIAGAGRITLETDTVQIKKGDCAKGHTCRVPGDYVRLSVTDTGSGIDPDILPHIFEPFFTTKPPGKGTGLGLSTVYGIIKQNKGFIDCKTATGKGTTFNIFLPRYFENQETKTVPNPEAFRSAGKQTILLVEDEKEVRDLCKSILENNDFKVWATDSAEKAIGIAARHADLIDLLLTDVKLPNMNGIELGRRFQAEYPKIRTLFMSGYTDWLTKSNVEKIHFISKPFTIRALLRAVKNALCNHLAH